MPDSASVAKHIAGLEATGYSDSNCFPDNIFYPVTENDIEITIYSLFN
jgi:hypothetical protein